MRFKLYYLIWIFVFIILNNLLPKLAQSDAELSILKVSPVNPRYFSDSSGKIVYLAGSHTWDNLIDGGYSDPPVPFNYEKYINFLLSHNHNFFRLWTWEDFKNYIEGTAFYYHTPLAFNRTGPGFANDGKLKFDLYSLNQAYFDRLRQRVITAWKNRIYVSIMLFQGWSVNPKHLKGKLWEYHPFNKQNNINGINGDPNNTGWGEEVHTLSIDAISEVQKSYLKKTIDTVNDLPNVLYEICNECEVNSLDWQYYIIDYIKKYESKRKYQHPVGMTAIYPNGKNSDLFASGADWISPNGDSGYGTNPPPSDGAKVIISDTDHIWGLGGDRVWAWKSFVRGYNLLFMDVYDNSPRLFLNPSIKWNNSTWESLRHNLGYIRKCANKMDIGRMVPHGELSSSGYALANLSSKNAEYLVYIPIGGRVKLNLKNTSGNLSIEWLNPNTGKISHGKSIKGGAMRSIKAPFHGDAVLYLHRENDRS